MLCRSWLPVASPILRCPFRVGIPACSRLRGCSSSSPTPSRFVRGDGSSRLTSARNLRGWLLTITHRCAMDAHRAGRRTLSHDDPASLSAAPVVDGPVAPDDGLWARVEALPPRQREAVVLKYVGDLDHRAVAAALGTSPAMSRRLVSDALATLRLDAEDLR